MNDWIKIFSSSFIHKIQLLLALLEENEIKAFVINKTDSMHLHLSATTAEIEVYVSQSDVMKAKHIISKSLL